MAVIDVVTYCGEKELLDLRYQILKDYVDEFIVIEFDKTFSGRERKLCALPNNQDHKFHHFQVFEETYNKYRDLAISSPNTEYGKGAEHWVREFCQKESIKDCLTHLQDDDIVFIGDCDEVWNPELLIKEFLATLPHKLKLRVYTYWLNNRSSEQFWGTYWDLYVSIKDKCLNHLRTDSDKTEKDLGWHFTSLKDNLKQKLEDSYTKETYATDAVMTNLEENIKNNKDFLGRDFKYWIDETDWPDYLKEHKDKYKHLCK